MKSHRGYDELEHTDSFKFNFKERELWLQCCDCHLTHKFKFKVKGDTLIVKCKRMDRETAKLRKAHGYEEKDQPPGLISKKTTKTEGAVDEEKQPKAPEADATNKPETTGSPEGILPYSAGVPGEPGKQILLHMQGKEGAG